MQVSWLMCVRALLRSKSSSWRALPCIPFRGGREEPALFSGSAQQAHQNWIKPLKAIFSLLYLSGWTLCEVTYRKKLFCISKVDQIFIFYSLLWPWLCIKPQQVRTHWGLLLREKWKEVCDKTLDSAIIWEKTLTTQTPSFLHIVAVSQISFNPFLCLDCF